MTLVLDANTLQLWSQIPVYPTIFHAHENEGLNILERAVTQNAVGPQQKKTGLINPGRWSSKLHQAYTEARGQKKNIENVRDRIQIVKQTLIYRTKLLWFYSKFRAYEGLWASKKAKLVVHCVGGRNAWITLAKVSSQDWQEHCWAMEFLNFWIDLEHEKLTEVWCLWQ